MRYANERRGTIKDAKMSGLGLESVPEEVLTALLEIWKVRKESFS